MTNEQDKKAARAAVNALVKTGNKDLADLGLSMMPQEDKDAIAAIVKKVRHYEKVMADLVQEFPHLNQWLSPEKLEAVVPGSALLAADAMCVLEVLCVERKDKIVQFFDTIVLDDEALNISMGFLAVLPILVDNTRKQTGAADEEIVEGIYAEFIKRLHLVPHVEGFPDTPESLRTALQAVLSDGMLTLVQNA